VYLGNAAKIKLSLTCKWSLQFQTKFLYHEIVDIFKIIKLSYFDNFTSVCASASIRTVPKNVKQITYVHRNNVAHLKHNFHPLMFPKFFTIDGIFKTITVLHLPDWLNMNIDGYIPEGVQTLVFGNYFNQPIDKSCLPTSLTSMIFGTEFNQPLENTIPDSVTYVQLGSSFTQSQNKGFMGPNRNLLVRIDYKQI
jgi:hypothetical protein